MVAYQTADPTIYERVDPKVSFEEQLQADHTGPVVMIGQFVFESEDDMKAFITGSSGHSGFMRSQPGYIGTRVFKGIGGANVMMFQAEWESLAAFRAAGKAEIDARAAAEERLAAEGAGATPSLEQLPIPVGRRLLVQPM